MKQAIRQITFGEPGSAITRIEQTTYQDPLDNYSDAEIREAMSTIGGEPLTGYEGPEVKDNQLGDFSCQNCEYFSAFSLDCSNDIMVKYSTRPRSLNNKPIVHPSGCCEQVSRLGLYFNGQKRQV